MKKDPKFSRTEFYAPGYATDGSNGSRWMAAPDDQTPTLQLDLGEPRDLVGTEIYFVQPTHGHAYKLETSLDGKTWQPYAEHAEVRVQSPHQDKKSVRARHLRLTILRGTPGVWEFRAYSKTDDTRPRRSSAPRSR